MPVDYREIVGVGEMKFYFSGDEADLKKSGIYVIVNLKNGKKYLGSAKKLERRFKYHFYMLARNMHSNKHLQNAFNKFGENNFEFKIIEFCNKESCLNIEQKYLDEIFSMINHDDFYYNIAKNATSPMLGLKLSPEACLKVSKAFKGKSHTEEAKEKNRQAHLGKKHTEESKNKIKNSLIGSKNPRYISKIMAQNILTKEVIITDSLNEMARKLNCSVMTISRRLCEYSKNHTNSPVFEIWVLSRIK